MPIAEQQLREITTDIWSVMLGMALEGRAEPATHVLANKALTGCVQIIGAWQGAVTIDLPAALARQACATMLNVDERECTADDVQDTVGELVNMAGGNVKALLPGPSQLSLPSVTMGRDFHVTLPRGRIIARATFDCGGQPVQVTVYERHHPDAAQETT